MKNKLNGKTNHVIFFMQNITAWKCMHLDHVHYFWGNECEGLIDLLKKTKQSFKFLEPFQPLYHGNIRSGRERGKYPFLKGKVKKRPINQK